MPPEREGGTRGEPGAISYDFSGSATLFGLLRERAEGQLRLEASDVSYAASLEVYRLLKGRRHILYTHQVSGTLQSERLLPGAVRISWDFTVAVLGVLPIRWHDESTLQFTSATDKVMVEIRHAGSDPTTTDYPPDTVDLLTVVVQTSRDLKTGTPPRAITLVDRHGSLKRAEVVSQGIRCASTLTPKSSTSRHWNCSVTRPSGQPGYAWKQDSGVSIWRSSVTEGLA